MIFIVDDSKTLLERLVNMLSEIEGVKIIGQARCAEEALVGIRNLKPEVVILDIQMKGGNGIDVLRTIKQYTHPPTVIMLTNHSYPQYKEKCMEFGADYFLDKTKDLDKLAEIIKDINTPFMREGLSGGGIR